MLRNDKSLSSFYNLGKNHYNDGLFAEAISDYTLAIQDDPTNVSAHYYRAKSYLNLGMLADKNTDYINKHVKAITDFTVAIQLDPASANLHYSRGLAHWNIRQFAEAIADFTAAIELDPTFANAYDYRARSYLNKGLLADAIADFTTLITLKPACASVSFDRGNAYCAHGKLAEAISDYNKVLEIDPRQNLSSEYECVLSKVEKGDLDGLDKQNIFSVIKKLPPEKQVRFLEQCLDKSTPLGQRFCQPEGLTASSLGKGIIKEIRDHLRKISFEPNRSKRMLDNCFALFGFRSIKTRLQNINLSSRACF